MANLKQPGWKKRSKKCWLIRSAKEETRKECSKVWQQHAKRKSHNLLGHRSRTFLTRNRFVCAVPARQVNSSPRLFRSYVSRSPSFNPKIWEAARATSAAPSFFKRIAIGEPGVEEEFVDGAIGYNNPVQLAIQEAIENSDPDERVSCIVSIGTGKARLAGFKKPGLLQRVVPVDLIKTLAAMATSSETASKILAERYRNCPELYHRLNVETGLSAIALGEWEKLSEVKTHTVAYLEAPQINREIDVIVRTLLGRAAHSYQLGSLGK